MRATCCWRRTNSTPRSPGAVAERSTARRRLRSQLAEKIGSQSPRESKVIAIQNQYNDYIYILNIVFRTH